MMATFFRGWGSGSFDMIMTRNKKSEGAAGFGAASSSPRSADGINLIKCFLLKSGRFYTRSNSASSPANGMRGRGNNYDFQKQQRP